MKLKRRPEAKRTKFKTSSLVAMKFSVTLCFLRHQPSPLKPCMSFSSVHVRKKQPRLDQTQKRSVSEIPFQNPFETRNQLNAGVLSQSALSNLTSWIPKVPSWLEKTALSLSQSPFSNFTPYVIKNYIVSHIWIKSLSSNNSRKLHFQFDQLKVQILRKLF